MILLLHLLVKWDQEATFQMKMLCGDTVAVGELGEVKEKKSWKDVCEW